MGSGEARMRRRSSRPLLSELAGKAAQGHVLRNRVVRDQQVLPGFAAVGECMNGGVGTPAQRCGFLGDDSETT
jgi:hypothetical protein